MDELLFDQLKLVSWDCIILEGASEQEEELMKNVLSSLHSIGLKNKIDAKILFIAGDVEKINQFENNNPYVTVIRVVEEVNDSYQYAISTLAHLPIIIDELVNE
ncbi:MULTISPECIES: hypothetical protein [unclassified Bacillus (in: firmicutes)]|uniref:hypothetical protein n=1 Tax=unclassified Bacillus (in: firmicutes) TaxID=185979 RepID=UPI000BEF9C0B|nr:MULTISPECIES: hypothetical protein [unclassified Bacillus (in: firmicutes)]PEJ52139.1 hypothetical protein CN692_22415 [Bacillus sp. AFS002410]PEL11237.1 hypothetical protein CN601_10810 [Bacillus sp. AFS017336]